MLQDLIKGYKRECLHGDICEWKNCPECREFMLTRCLSDKFIHLLEEIRHKIHLHHIDYIEDSTDQYVNDGVELCENELKQYITELKNILN
jgi:hypothetical protein